VVFITSAAERTAGMIASITNQNKGKISFIFSTGNVNGASNNVRTNTIQYSDGINVDNDFIKGYQYSDDEHFAVEGNKTYHFYEVDKGPTLCDANDISDWTVFSNSSVLLNRALDGFSHGYRTVSESIYSPICN
jgi:hypothetical protein